MTSPSPPSSSSTKLDPQTIDLATVPTPQLSQIKNQIAQELANLTNSFTQLRAAQAKFRECVNSIRDGVVGKKEGTPILVPLTPSLYVPGHLASTDTVIVDVGTGFYVEKTASHAQKFYTQKVAELGRTLQDLESIVQSKQGNLRVVEDVLRQKVISESAAAEPSSSS